jgi:hypothetical protein
VVTDSRATEQELTNLHLAQERAAEKDEAESEREKRADEMAIWLETGREPEQDQEEKDKHDEAARWLGLSQAERSEASVREIRLERAKLWLDGVSEAEAIERTGKLPEEEG